ncbi:MAG TPA: hypothetical protein VEB19_00255 [Gemmatimonadaceae bacterium]|nr:hypothetical protein [Gemmatimonadaceae bacterium]
MDEERLRDAAGVDYGELPELTRTLRALGSARRGGTSQELFFTPLLEARKRAEGARTAEAKIRAFDASDLRRALEKAVERIIADWPDDRPSIRRALRAELSHRVQSYNDALSSLSARAAEASHASDETRLAAWRAWTTQLTLVFDVADRTWMMLRKVVDSLPKGRP